MKLRSKALARKAARAERVKEGEVDAPKRAWKKGRGTYAKDVASGAIPPHRFTRAAAKEDTSVTFDEAVAAVFPE